MKRITILILFIVASTDLFAQFDGARLYWAFPRNLNLVTAHLVTGEANASFTNVNFINPNVKVSNQLYMLTYNRSVNFFGRTFYSTLIVPAGSITTTTDVSVGGISSSSTSFEHGFGDLIWSNTINILGSPDMGIYDFMRHEPPTQVYFQAAVTFPTGHYESENDVNMGSNQYKLKLGFPIVQRIGPWVTGKKTTLDIFPSYTFIGKNDDFQGLELEQDGLFVLESHLTRDLTRDTYLSFDYSYINGGDSDFILPESGMVVQSQEGQDVHLAGLTLAYNVNDHFNVNVTHNQTFSSGNDNISLDGTFTRVRLTWIFHDFKERMDHFLESN